MKLVKAPAKKQLIIKNTEKESLPIFGRELKETIIDTQFNKNENVT